MTTDIRSVAERLDAAARTDLRGLAERLDQTGPLDLQPAHALIKRGMRHLAERLYTALPVTPHPLAARYHRYGSTDGRMTGELQAYTGDRLDWVIDSFIAAPAMGFCNHHLTIWLPPTLKVPHLAFAVGTIPQLFFFCDLVPRADLWVDEAELDTYHARFNERFLAMTADTRFRPFVSKELYIREAISPIGLCVEGQVTTDNIEHVLALAADTLDTWIDWVRTAPTVPPALRAALGARDEKVRETICRRDPANIVAERVLGKEVTDDLVRILSGIGRDA
jgi:hypothetical protein